MQAREYGKRAAAYEIDRSDRFHQHLFILGQNTYPDTLEQRRGFSLGWLGPEVASGRSYMRPAEYGREAFGQIGSPATLLRSGTGVFDHVSWAHHLQTLHGPHDEFIENCRQSYEAFHRISGQTNISAAYVTAPQTQGRLSGPVKFVRSLLKTWRLTQDDAIPLLGYEDSDQRYVSSLLSGHATLSGRDVKDRIIYLFQIRKTLSALFLNEDVENEWLREKHNLLDDIAPMELMLEGTMENLLLVKEYVDTAAGK